jgi:3-oxoacyl-[acyl-carrier protein] reductase
MDIIGMYRKGDSYRDKFLITENVVNSFAKFSEDFNPIHMDINFANIHGYTRQVSHGVIQLAYISKMIGMKFPGHGSMWMKQTVNWLIPVLTGDEIEIILIVKSFSSGTNTLTLLVEIFNQKNKKVMTGESQVKLTKKLSSSAISNIGLSNYNSSLAVEKYENNNNLKKSKSQRRVALITGASRGIGAEISKKLAYDGYSVVVNYKNDRDSANAVVENICNSGGNAISLNADITKSDQISNMLKIIFEKWGRCDIVVHGATPPLKIIKTEDTTYKDVSAYLDVYLGGAISLVENTCLLMKSNKFGRYVFLGTSYLFGIPPHGMSSYVVAKEALWGYTKSLASDFGRFGITANMVSPSLTITDLTSDVPARVKEVESMKSPMRRLVNTKDIAHQVAYLCSDNSGYVNGVNVSVTGGPI